MDFIYYANYFSLLEERLIDTQKYVAFEKENLNTFSIEFASIINDCCGLINGFFFELCQNKSTREEFNIRDYKKFLLKGFYQINQCVYCDKFFICPWEKLVINKNDSKNSTPLWWNDYNAIKHSGKPNFQKATLKTAISCMAGMFSLLVMYDFKRLGNTMCNWKGIFSCAGNYKKDTDWEC